MIRPSGVGRLPRRPVVAALVVLLLATRGEALEARVTEWQVAGGTVRAAVELRDVFADRFRKLVEDGRTLHVQVTSELWETRTLWDRLVRAPSASVFGAVRDPALRTIVVEDAAGTRLSFASFPKTMVVWIDVAPASRFDASRTYYLHLSVTVGTVAEREIEGVSDAVFGTGEASGLGALGKLFFQKVLKLADYLQSESCETTSRKTPGRDILCK